MSEQLPIEETKPVILNTAHARAMLHKQYGGDEWCLLEEVTMDDGRSVDAVAVNLWQSRGHAVHAIEIKVSRGDWLKELKQPAKQESIHRFCDYFFVLAPAGIIKDGELPEGWGQLELRNATVGKIKPARKNETREMSRSFFSMLVRRNEQRVAHMAGKIVSQELIRLRDQHDKSVASHVGYRTKEAEQIMTRVKKFEEETGLTISGYSGPPIATIKLAQALERLNGYGENEALHRITKLADELDGYAKTLRAAVEASGLK